MNFFRRLKNFILVLILAVSFFPAEAFAVTQAQIDSAKANREAVAEKKRAQQEIIDQLSLEQDGILAIKKALEEKISYTQEQIRYNSEVISGYDEMIEEKAVEVAAARSLEQKQLKLYRARVRAMEENGEFSVLDLLFQAENLGAFISAVDDISEIMERDKELEAQYVEAREKHEAVQKEYEEIRADLLDKQEILREEQNALQTDIDAQQAQVDAIQMQIVGNQAVLAQIESEWEELNEQVNSLINQLNARLAPGALQGAGFIWPCGCTYITSRVGYRLHPVSGVWRNHDGMDVGCSYGEAVWAAASGTVCLSGYNGGYGNCVMINHNNGFFTLYGHLSSVAVSNGQTVTSGQTIGYVGSTGNSTGPHLHFEMRMGETIVDPESFFGTGTFSYAADAGA